MANRTHLLIKKTLYNFMQLSAVELAPNIRVNSIAPGLILPPSGQDETYLEHKAQAVPLKTFGSLQDITRTLKFLVQSPFITGQVIFVDGGEHLI